MIQQSQPVTQTGQQPAATQPQQKEHIVVAGESLEQIAKNYGVSVKQLRRLNSVSVVQPGQKLKIPAPKTAAAPVAPAPTGTTPSATK